MKPELLPCRRTIFVTVFACAAMTLYVPFTQAADEEAAADEKESKPTVLAGVFQSIAAVEIKAGTEELTSLEIKRIVPHGTVVKANQNLVWFDTKDVDKKIKDAQTALTLAEIDFQDEEFAHRQFAESQKLDRAAANRAMNKAKQDFDNFTQVDRERQIESAKFSLKSSQASLANAMEELNQLKQMYEEDDLTEESEEIVLKRAQQAVESAQFRLKGTEVSTRRTIQQTVPRSQQTQKATLTRAELAHAKTTRDLDSARKKREIEMKKKRDAFQEQQAKFKALQEERKNLVLQSPHDGIAFHGKLVRGKVSDKPSTLKANTSVTSQQVLVTLADPARLQVRVDLAEKDLSAISVGAKGTAKATAFTDQEFPATVKSISAVPYAGTKYDCVLSVKIPKGLAIVPGMTCSIEFETE